MLVARLARRDVKVILSGDGGDELFWGYPSRFVPVLNHTRKFGYPHWVRFGLWGMGRLFGNGNYDLRCRDIGNCYRLKHSRIYDRQLRTLFHDVAPWPARFDLFTYSGWDTDRTAQWLRWNEFVGHLTMVLLKVDRASMYHSLEVRVPLLDREVIQIASRVNWRSCLDLTRELGKLPLREALNRHVPVQAKTKRGFEVPMNAWLRGPLKQVFADAVLARKEILGLPIDQKQLHLMFQQHCDNLDDHARALWTLLSLALWERQHYDRRLRRLEQPTVEPSRTTSRLTAAI
jgi:asparagine synthase (glutamine-hydrolysing)